MLASSMDIADMRGIIGVELHKSKHRLAICVRTIVYWFDPTLKMAAVSKVEHETRNLRYSCDDRQHLYRHQISRVQICEFGFEYRVLGIMDI